MDRKLEVLRGAYKRVTDSWTRGYLARDEHNREVGPHDPRAVSWCAIGALSAEIGGRVNDHYDPHDPQLLFAIERELAITIKGDEFREPKEIYLEHCAEHGYDPEEWGGEADEREAYECTITSLNDNPPDGQRRIREALVATIARLEGASESANRVSVGSAGGGSAEPGRPESDVVDDVDREANPQEHLVPA